MKKFTTEEISALEVNYERLIFQNNELVFKNINQGDVDELVEIHNLLGTSACEAQGIYYESIEDTNLEDLDASDFYGLVQELNSYAFQTLVIARSRRV